MRFPDLAQRYSGQGGGNGFRSRRTRTRTTNNVAQHAPPEEVAGGLVAGIPLRPDAAVSGDGVEPVQPLRSESAGRVVEPAAQRRSDRARWPDCPGLAGLLGGGGEVTPQQASQVSPEQVQQIAAQAEKQNPSVVDQVSSFYSQHPQVVKALGGLALTIALQHMMRRR